MSWSCPLCHLSLSKQQNSYICPQGHQFDVAKEGYINLLPVQHKRSREPGDSAEMMQARRAFLDAGHYRPLRDKIYNLLSEYHLQQILDIGCGEGYYTHAFAAVSDQTFGLDVSKAAVRAAAKRYPEVQFCVASSQRLPFGDASMHAVIRIYAPCNPAELARVTKAGGLVITAAPGPRHLLELKGLIYDEVKLHESSHDVLPGFLPVDTYQLAYPMTLTGKEAAALLQMTPFAWRAKPDVWQTLDSKTQFMCQTDFIIQIWQREG